MKLFKITTTLALTSLLASCSSGFKRPESFQEKMARFKSKNLGQNHVPKVVVNSQYLTSNAKVKRGPASVKTKNNSLPYNNKKLYFLTLLDQYDTLKSFSKSQSAPTLEICPKFHSTLIYHQEEYTKTTYSQRSWTPVTYDKSKLKDHTYLAAHPELLLPVTESSIEPTVADYIGKKDYSKNEVDEVLHKALDIHLSKTFSEIKELCEYGSSDNYYNYENLMTLVKKESHMKVSETNANTLLKTTIFSNMILKKSIHKSSKRSKGRSIASSSFSDQVFETEVVNRLGVEWSNDYINNVVNQ